MDYNIRGALASPYMGSSHIGKEIEKKKAKRMKLASIAAKVGAVAANFIPIPGVAQAASAALLTTGKMLKKSSDAHQSEADLTLGDINTPKQSPDYTDDIISGVGGVAQGALSYTGGMGDVAESFGASELEPQEYRKGGKFMKSCEHGGSPTYHSVNSVDPKDLKKLFSSHKMDVYEVGGDLHSDPSGGTPIQFSSGYKGDMVMAERGELLLHKKDDNSPEGETLYFVTNHNNLSGKYKNKIKKLPPYDYLSASRLSDGAMKENDSYLNSLQVGKKYANAIEEVPMIEHGGNLKSDYSADYLSIDLEKNPPGRSKTTDELYKLVAGKKMNMEMKVKPQAAGMMKQMKEKESYKKGGKVTKAANGYRVPFTEDYQELGPADSELAYQFPASPITPIAPNTSPSLLSSFSPKPIGKNDIPSGSPTEETKKDKYFTRENALGITGTATNMAASLYGLFANKPHYVNYDAVLGNYDNSIREGKKYLQQAKGINNEEIALGSNVMRSQARNTGSYNTMASALSSVAQADARSRTQANASYDTALSQYIAGTAGPRADIAFKTKATADQINTQEYDKLIESNQRNLDRIGTSFKELQLQRNSKITNRQLEKLLEKSGLAGADAMTKELIKIYLKDRYKVEYKDKE